MSLLNPALLAGFGLALIPILLHLLLRAKPKRLIFPALRLIQQRRRQNVRRMQLRHLWLLLLRIAVIALIVLAVCRPSLPAANYSLTAMEWGMLLGIIVIALAAYFGIMRWWQRQSMSRTALLTRRTMLRGGIGAAAVLLALVGVAWPYAHRVAAEIKNPAPISAENIPVAAVFLFDNSVSMSYKQANKTRLRAAQDMAKIHLSHLASGSKVAVASTSETTPAAFSTDLVAAQSRIEALDVNAASRPLDDRLATLLRMQEEDQRRIMNEQSSVPADKRQDRFIRGIYIFTDLAKSAWREQSSGQLKEELARLRWAGVYLIDVGENSPVNVALTDVKLSREAVPARATVRVEAVVSGTGAAKPDQTVELYLREGEGPPIRKGSQSITLEPGTETRVSFFPVDIPQQPYTQGELRVAGSDPLTADDVVYFNVHTIPAMKVLVVAERPAISQYWTLALKNLSETGVTAYEVENATPGQLADRDLTEFDVVCLLNASQPSDAVWNKLQSFVEGGGGLAVFLGASSTLVGAASSDKIDPLRYGSEAAMTLLPGKLTASVPHSPAQTMDLRQTQHGMLKRLDEVGAVKELGLIDIRRYWKVEPTDDAIVVSRYTSHSEEPGAAALIERRIGQGRVMMMTTGVDGVAWNDLLQDPGWYVVFADQLIQYLAWQASGTFNHTIGDEVRLPLDRERSLAKLVLRMPDFKQRVIDIPAKSQLLTLRDLAAVGSYSVDSADRAIDYHIGFSVNLPAAESDLKRIEPSELDELLGEKRYSSSENIEGLAEDERFERLGQEMYGMVIAFLVAVFAVEQFTATWFYRTDEA